jgi:hypothetical protein
MLLSDKIFVLKSEVGVYPYKIRVYDPRGDESPPSWLTDVLKLEKIDDGKPVYFKSVSKSGTVTYQVPCINGHLTVPVNSIVAYDEVENNIFTIDIGKFEVLYEEKYSILETIKKNMYALYKKFRCESKLFR